MTEQTPRQESVGTEGEPSASSSDETTNSTSSDKKGHGYPKNMKRVRLCNQQKIEAVQHFKSNPGMTQAALIDWCFHKFGMQKSRQSLVQGGWKGTTAKLEKAIASEVNPFVLKAKSSIS